MSGNRTFAFAARCNEAYAEVILWAACTLLAQ